MANYFRFPDVGEGVTEGEIVKWRVKKGQKVKQDQVLVEVETDKAVVEIPSPQDGIILKINHNEGDIINVGDVLVVIGKKGEKVSAKSMKKESVGVVGELDTNEEEIAMPIESLSSVSKSGVQVLPSVRRLAKDLGVDISKIKGSGKNGRITEEDVRGIRGVKKVVQKSVKVTKKYDMYGYIDRIPLKGMRKTIARRMKESVQISPHVVHMDVADVTKLIDVREKAKKAAKKKKIHLTFLAYIVKAVSECLKKHPYLNASMDDDYSEIILKKYYNIGIAVDTKDGLIVPVVKRVEIKNILDIAKEIEDLADKARKRKLDIMDIKGNSFTITNVGSVGGLFATPIINQPDSAIMALGRIQDWPFSENGSVRMKKVQPFSISFDHRIVDGAEVARFGETFKKYLKNLK